MFPSVQRYIDLGFVIHPCCPADHKCQSPGKIPFDPIEGRHMSGWQTHTQFSLDQWQEWLDYDSSINIGFLCGSPSGLICLDIDNKEGEAIIDDCGIEGWRETWRYETGRGFRCLFRFREAATSTILSRGTGSIEVLGDGRQSVLPPSLHPNGRRYRWVGGLTPRSIRPVNGDNWARQLAPAGEITSDKEDWIPQIQSDTQQGNRNTTMVRLAGHLMNPCPMPADEAYIWLQLYNKEHCKPPLPDREVRSIVSSIGKKEASQQAEKDREVRSLMTRYDLTYQQAETMWRGL